MTKAIRIHKTGGPDVLQWDDISVGKPGKGEALVKQTAAGLNYIDTYQRSGLYPVPLPSVLGSEGCGVVEAVGEGVTDIKVGDRVAYHSALGAYAERRIMPAWLLVPVPAGIDDRTAAAMMLKGCTVQYLLKRTYPVKKGDTILFHAAAGGVGLIAGQWAKHLGVTTIGTVGSEEKATLARQNGYTHVINYNREDFVVRVKEITGGKGLPVVYDSVGKDTFMKSLDCLQRRGMMVTFGQSSGAVEPISTGLLSGKGSLYLTRPTLGHYTANRAEVLETANDLFDVVKRGIVKIPVNQTYALKDTAQAHRDLEGRKTTGTTVLTI